MIKLSLIIILGLIQSSCTQRAKTTDFSDDYVLIEFAAKLEEDYSKIYPQPLDKSSQNPTE